MNYIVLDLEWNQCPYGKSREEERLPFEIVEIGAVKMNEQKEIIDTFHILVKPIVYRRLHYRTQEVITLSMEDLQMSGLIFPEAVGKFLIWCGEGDDEFCFCTWGTTDLTELQRNMAFYYMEDLLPGPIYYEDVQKLFAITFETRKERRALEYAVDFLKIEDNGEFHQALDDAVYTARVLSFIPDEIIDRNYSIDCYQNPRTREEEIKVRYDTYEKFISREFLKSGTAMATWPSSRSWGVAPSGNLSSIISSTSFSALPLGKIRVRRAVDGAFFAIRTTKLIGESEVDKIRGKQLSLRAKRQKKGRK